MPASGFCDGGTIFQATRIPLRLWFQAMQWIITHKNGAGTLEPVDSCGFRVL